MPGHHAAEEIEQQGRGDQRDDHHSTEFSAESASISGFEIRPFSRDGRSIPVLSFRPDATWSTIDVVSYLLVVAFGSRISNAFRCNADSGGQGCRHVG